MVNFPYTQNDVCFTDGEQTPVIQGYNITETNVLSKQELYNVTVRIQFL